MMDDTKITVLVVDDEADFRQLMTFWLQSKGYGVITAENGAKAIEEIKAQSPDIVFVDLRMPVLDGPGTIKKIREFDKELPIIIISAHVDDPQVKEMSAYGISGEFCKGWDFKKGLSLLETVLRTHRRLRK